jgi:hypothetical protein
MDMQHNELESGILHQKISNNYNNNRQANIFQKYIFKLYFVIIHKAHLILN